MRQSSYRHTNQNSGGCGACSGTGWPTDREIITDLLGFDSTIEPAYDWDSIKLMWAPGDSVDASGQTLPADDPRRSPEQHISTITGKPDFQGYRIYRYQGSRIDQDPYEIRNLASDPQHADRARQMLDRLKGYMAEVGDTEGPGAGSKKDKGRKKGRRRGGQ